MSGRPKRASALAATAAIKDKLKRGRYENDDDGDDEREPTKEPKAKRRRPSDEPVQVSAGSVPATNFSPELPAEIWGLIMQFAYTNSTSLKDFLGMRTVSKLWAEASTFNKANFWRRLSERFLRTTADTNMEKIVREHYRDSWFNFSRYCLVSRLAFPSFRGNPSRTSYAAPFTAPKKPVARWILHHGDKNSKSPISTLTFCTWRDRGVFVTQDQTVVCVDLASGAEVWSRKLSPPDAPSNASFTAHDFSLEIRVTPSASAAPNAPHVDFFEAQSVVCLCNQQTLTSLNIKTGEIEWSVNAEKDYQSRFWGGIVVLPHGCIATLRENRSPHELFAVMFNPVGGAVSWKTSLEAPGKYNMGNIAADARSGLCVVCVGAAYGSPEVDFVALRLFDGKMLVSKMPNPPEALPSEEMWCNDKNFMLEDENVIFLVNNAGEEAHVESRNVFTGRRRLLVKNTAFEDDEEEEEEEEGEDDEDEQPKKTTKKKTSKKAAKQELEYNGEFSMEICMDPERRQIFLPGCWAGGGGAYDLSLFSISCKSGKPTWSLSDGEKKDPKSPWKSAFGTEKMRRISLYGVTCGIPVCDSEGSSIWPVCPDDSRQLLVVDSTGRPKVLCNLYKDVAGEEPSGGDIDDDEESDDREEELLRAGPEEFMQPISAAQIRLAKVNGKNWVLFCTNQWIWAASD